MEGKQLRMYNAQTCQDVFVDKILNKDGGFFVDIGAGTGGLPSSNPGFYSNTYFFEAFRSWTGIAIDYDSDWYFSVKNSRNCKCVCEDLLEKNINEILSENECPELIDYISIDVDDAQWKVFHDFNFSKYKFNVLTLEHNLFQTLESCTQNRSEEHKQKVLKEYDAYREVLSSHGYKILWADVNLDGYGPVEDWWVSQEIFDRYADIYSESNNFKEAFNVISR